MIWYCFVIIGVFSCSCSQILLKKSAIRKNNNIILRILNWRVVFSYVIFFLSLLVNIRAMSQGVNLKDIPILESLGYVFVPLLSTIILREEFEFKTICSISLILIGVIVFYS